MILPPASSVRSLSPESEAMVLFEDDEDVALLHRLALLDPDLLHRAGILCLDGHLHLHRLEDDHGVALVDLVAGFDLDLPNSSGDVRRYVGHGAAEYPPCPRREQVVW